MVRTEAQVQLRCLSVVRCTARMQRLAEQMRKLAGSYAKEEDLRTEVIRDGAFGCGSSYDGSVSVYNAAGRGILGQGDDEKRCILLRAADELSAAAEEWKKLAVAGSGMTKGGALNQ